MHCFSEIKFVCKRNSLKLWLKVDRDFVASVNGSLFTGKISQRSFPKIVFTSLHGTSIVLYICPVTSNKSRVYKYKYCRKQRVPSGVDFPTVKSRSEEPRETLAWLQLYFNNKLERIL
jgi:hypothetical protein